jgi:predicted enzyme related to lactoylglutathione lyase
MEITRHGQRTVGCRRHGQEGGTGAVVGVWQLNKMTGAQSMGKANTYGWAELNSRGVDKAIPFYKKVFGWGAKKSEMAGSMDYTQFLAGGESIAGGMEMNSMIPAQVPSHWQVSFTVEDVEKTHKKAVELGDHEMLAPQDFPGGRFSIRTDPQGASIRLLKMKQ